MPFESNFRDKEVLINIDSNELAFKFKSPKYEYLSLMEEGNHFSVNFGDFYYDLKRGNGIDLRIPLSEIEGSNFKAILLDEHYEILEDSTVDIIAEHTYIEYKLP